jgi:hypothetical protein
MQAHRKMFLFREHPDGYHMLLRINHSIVRTTFLQ